MLRLLLLLLFSSSISLSQEKERNVIYHSLAAIKAHKSIQYHLSYKFKFLDQVDTISFQNDVALLRQYNDTLIHGFFFFNIGDSIDKFYGNGNFATVEKKKRKVELVKINANNISNIYGNIYSDAIWSYFLEPDKWIKLYDSTNTFKRLKDTTILNMKCYKIQIAINRKDEFVENNILFIDAVNYMPIIHQRTIVYQGNTQYSEFFISKYTFDKVPLTKFSIDQIPKNYLIDYGNKTNKKDSSQLLETGSYAPDITGSNYQNNMNIESILFKSKVTILDFWYTSCYPCIKAILIFEKLKEDYRNNVQILGINNIDNTISGVQKLPKFLKYNEIKYPIILVDKSVIRSYKISAWPTIYIIDKGGKIVFSQNGNSDDLYDKLKQTIDSCLK